MRIVVQRVANASVEVESRKVGAINNGLLVLVGFTEGDNKEKIDYCVNKLINMRIFDDDSGIMNMSVKDIGGKILSISQFTLYADTAKGNRPSYAKAMKSDEAVELYKVFNDELRKQIEVEEGIFGAEMMVSLVNDGPITIILER